MTDINSISDFLLIRIALYLGKIDILSMCLACSKYRKCILNDVSLTSRKYFEKNMLKYGYITKRMNMSDIITMYMRRENKLTTYEGWISLYLAITKYRAYQILYGTFKNQSDIVSYIVAHHTVTLKDNILHICTLSRTNISNGETTETPHENIRNVSRFDTAGMQLSYITKDGIVHSNIFGIIDDEIYVECLCIKVSIIPIILLLSEKGEIRIVHISLSKNMVSKYISFPTRCIQIKKIEHFGFLALLDDGSVYTIMPANQYVSPEVPLEFISRRILESTPNHISPRPITVFALPNYVYLLRSDGTIYLIDMSDKSQRILDFGKKIIFFDTSSFIFILEDGSCYNAKTSKSIIDKKSPDSRYFYCARHDNTNIKAFREDGSSVILSLVD